MFRTLSKVSVAIAVLAVGLGLSLGDGSANALSISGSGSPGTASLVQATLNQSNGLRYMTAGNGVAYKSAAYAGYNQWVCATTRFYKLMVNSNGTANWAKVDQGAPECGWILKSQSAITLRQMNYWNPMYTFGYGVDVVISWKLSPTATTSIGTRTYDFNKANDYACLVSQCVVNSHYQQGGYISNWKVM